MPATPEKVWRALTDPAAPTAWFWPPRLEPAAEVEDALRKLGYVYVTVDLEGFRSGAMNEVLPTLGFRKSKT